MKTILVDDEPLAMQRFCKLAKEIPSIEVVGKFESPSQALKYVLKNEVNLAVLDINMPEMNGIELGEALREINPDMILIFITGYEQYALDAFNLSAAAYLMKPYDAKDLEYAIESARLLSKRGSNKVFVKTFGRFDIFVNGEPVFFKHSKSKELLALLIDAKGSTITSEYAISKLWEDKPYDSNSKSLYYKASKNLEKTLDKNGISNIIIKTRYATSVNIKAMSCDYYDLLEGNEKAKRNFNDDYMSQYSWGEETLAYIIKNLK